jgi:Amt family ammonium transporter
VLNSGDTAWMLVSTALVLFMTPGLALFYGGMVRSKSVLNMIMMSFSSIAIVGVLWVLYGYSVSFGSDIGGILGNPGEAAGLQGTFGATPIAEDSTIPTLVFVAFQATFAIITVALISGAVADRMKFPSWVVFAVLWATLVYFPVCHWVWGGGWIGGLGVLDFAGGTAVHINAGAAALGLVLVLGKRIGWPREPMRPHNLTLVMLGAGILWLGWFGFNAGSALAADETAGLVLANTLFATCAAVIGWLLVEQIRDGKPTSLGAASGVVAGLVAITPACAFVTPMGSLAIGVIAGILCALAVGLKFRFGYDDSLDVVGVHLVGGLVGTLLIGFFGFTGGGEEGGDPVGLFYGGGIAQLGLQAVGAFAVLIYSGVVAALLGFLIKLVMGLRVSEEAEAVGVDETEHAESGYDFSSHRGVSGLGGSRPAAAATTSEQVPATAGKEA